MLFRSESIELKLTEISRQRPEHRNGKREFDHEHRSFPGNLPAVWFCIFRSPSLRRPKRRYRKSQPGRRKAKPARLRPDVGIGSEEPEYRLEFHDPEHTAVEYQSRYPEGIIRFEVVDSNGSPVQNARLGFTTEEEYRWNARQNAENGTDYSPSEYFAVRIDGTGTAQAGLIALDGSGTQVVEGLPRKLEVRVTQRAADGNPDRFHPMGHPHLGEHSPGL